MQNEMEITIYLNHEAYTKGKPLYVVRVSVLDSLEVDYSTLLRAFRIIYGINCVVVFTCL